MISQKWLPGFFISKRKEGKESKTAERLRESECERQSIAERER
jgi:hypothetical protein